MGHTSIQTGRDRQGSRNKLYKRLFRRRRHVFIRRQKKIRCDGACISCPVYHEPINRSDEVDHTSESTSHLDLANVQDTGRSYEPITHREPRAYHDTKMRLPQPPRATGDSKHLQPGSTIELLRTPLQQSSSYWRWRRPHPLEK